MNKVSRETVPHEVVLVDQYLESYFRRQEELGFLGRSDEPLGTANTSTRSKPPTAQGVETPKTKASKIPNVQGDGALDVLLDKMRVKDPKGYARLSLEYNTEFRQELGQHQTEVRLLKRWLALQL